MATSEVSPVSTPGTAKPPHISIRKMSIIPEVAERTDDVTKATELEHDMGFRQSLKVYRKAVLWSVALSTAIVMEGFDLILLGSLYGLPSFRRDFGEPQHDGTYELSAAWQTGLSNGVLVGQILGLFLNGVVADRYGCRRTMLGGLLLIVAFVFIPFFAQDIVTILIGQVLLGVPFGIFQTLACTYASEVCPTQLRAYMTTYVNLCWVIGQIICSGVLRGLVSRTDQWGYRIPFALQWLWPLPIFLAVVLAPESPWWLVRNGHVQEARRSVARLTSNASSEFDIDRVISLISYTDQLEKAASAGTAYADCFRGTNLRRTEIVCGIWAVQTLCGSALMGYSSYFYLQAGLDVRNAFTMTLVQFCIGGVGTVCSWFLMSWFGRRTLYLAGQCGLAVLLLLIGLASLAGRSNVASQWAIGSALLVYTFLYNCSVGPVCYALVSELPSTRLKAKSVVLARNTYNVGGILTNIVTPLMLNPTAWNWGARSGFFWAASCALCFVWTFFRVPEPKGRTYGELDLLFEAGVPARRFRGAVVEGMVLHEPGGRATPSRHLSEKNQGARTDT